MEEKCSVLESGIEATILSTGGEMIAQKENELEKLSLSRDARESDEKSI